MENKIILFLAVVLLVMTAGCEPVDTGTVTVHEGTGGLSIGFMEKSPPDEVYSNDVFPVTLDMKNTGAYDIDSGILALGVEREYVEVLDQEYLEEVGFSLTGRSVYDPIGGIDRRTIRVKARQLDPQSETLTTVVALSACYPYRTEATAQVCVDSDIHETRQQEKVCTPETIGMGTIDRDGQSLPRGQGAPIAITKIEQKMLPHDERDDLIKPSYMIYVKNMGNGLPVNVNDYEEACRATGITKDSLNVIGARVYLSDRTSELQLDCKPKFGSDMTDKTGYLKLEKDEDFIRCTLEQGMATTYGTFTTPLIIELDYGYTFTISKSVLIRRQV